MAEGPQDERMREMIVLAAGFLTIKNAHGDASFVDDAITRARTFLRDAVGEDQEGINAARAADRAAVLAIFRAGVAAGGSREAARSAAAHAYHRPRGRAPATSWDSLLQSEDPVAVLKKGSLSNGLRRGFGDSMQGHDEKGDDYADLVVTTCAFNDFFRKHGEADLTLIFCSADWSWMNQINASERPIAVERPTTLSTGASQCRFHFVRADPKQKPQADVVRSVPEALFD